MLLQAQQSTITFRVKNGEGKPVRVMRPVDGKYFVAFPPEDTLDASGALVLPNKEKVPGVFGFTYKKMYRLYVRPGKQYIVTIDESNKTAPVTFEGPDAEAQLALLRLSFDFYQSAAMRHYRKDTVFAGSSRQILPKGSLERVSWGISHHRDASSSALIASENRYLSGTDDDPAITA